MKAENSIKVSFSLWEYGSSLPHPRDIETPDNVINEAWVPQTFFEAIWKLFEFDCLESKQEFLENMPEVYSKARITNQDQEFFDTWTK